jgi:hypothetical protein
MSDQKISAAQKVLKLSCRTNRWIIILCTSQAAVPPFPLHIMNLWETPAVIKAPAPTPPSQVRLKRLYSAHVIRPSLPRCMLSNQKLLNWTLWKHERNRYI